jgi:hypothetical protein
MGKKKKLTQYFEIKKLSLIKRETMTTNSENIAVYYSFLGSKGVRPSKFVDRDIILLLSLVTKIVTEWQVGVWSVDEYMSWWVQKEKITKFLKEREQAYDAFELQKWAMLMT